MRSLKRGEKVHAPLATGCGRSSARRLEALARHGGHRGRSPGVSVPLRTGGRLLPQKGTYLFDLGGASAAESLNWPSHYRARIQSSGGLNPLSGSPSSAQCMLLSGCTGEGGGGVPRRLLSGVSRGCRAGHHVHILPASGRGSGLWVDCLVRHSSLTP